MIKSDFHTHTIFSDDSRAPFFDSLKHTMDSGMDILAITDHYDPGYPVTDMAFRLDFDNYFPALDQARELYPGRIAAGIEVGIMEGEFEQADKAAKSYDYDVVIGSFHCYRNLDVSIYTFTDEQLQKDGYAKSREDFLRKYYEYCFDCLKKYDNYDILGHLTYIDRYTGGLLDYSLCNDAIDEILRLVISRNKSLEINTASFRYKLDSWTPRESILRRYRQLGGEMITFGSDAHSPEYYRDHFDDAVELARSIGFRYHCIYKNRVPEMDTL